MKLDTDNKECWWCCGDCYFGDYIWWWLWRLSSSSFSISNSYTDNMDIELHYLLFSRWWYL